MQLFAILTDPENESLEKAIKGEFPDRYFDFGDGQWFVAGGATADRVYEKLDNADKYGDIGSLVVLLIAGRSGYASTKLWEWIAELGCQ